MSDSTPFAKRAKGLGWGSYARLLEEDQHEVGKQHTQKIDRKYLTLRTRIKLLSKKDNLFL
ncbi:MAG: IS1 family transposase [Cyanobacteria bacterium P01_A01_bin.123]